MAEVERIKENIANELRAGAVVSTMSQAVQERERPFIHAFFLFEVMSGYNRSQRLNLIST